MWSKLKLKTQNSVHAGQRFISADGFRREWIVDRVYDRALPTPHVNLRDAQDYQLSRMYAMSILLDRRYFVPLPINDVIS